MAVWCCAYLAVGVDLYEWLRTHAVVDELYACAEVAHLRQPSLQGNGDLTAWEQGNVEEHAVLTAVLRLCRHHLH